MRRIATRAAERSDARARLKQAQTLRAQAHPLATLQAQGLHLTLDYLGESVHTSNAATAAAREYLHVMDLIVASGIERNISLKLTQLGLDVDRATAVDNMRRILDPADAHGFFVRIDMENSPYTERTLEIFETLWGIGYRNAGVVIQSCLKRSEADIRRVNTLGARVRLVKGAYKEPAEVAFQQKSDVDAAYIALAKLLLEHGATVDLRDSAGDTALLIAARRGAAPHPQRGAGTPGGGHILPVGGADGGLPLRRGCAHRPPDRGAGG